MNHLGGLGVSFDQDKTSDNDNILSSIRRVRGSVSASATVDWSQSGGVSPVKNQGQCGSCWAFSSTATLESYFMIKNSSTIDLSEEYVLECTGPISTCGGGSVSDAFSLLTNTGDIFVTQAPQLNPQDLTWPTASLEAELPTLPGSAVPTRTSRNPTATPQRISTTISATPRCRAWCPSPPCRC